MEQVIDPGLEDLFWAYTHERYAMMVKRSSGAMPPWTTDAILANHRFTNVFRASDRVSQFLIRNVQYGQGLSQEPSEVLFRTVLFKLFNQIDTWLILKQSLGETPSLGNFNVALYSKLLSLAVARGEKIWNNAYMITPPPEIYGGAKHEGWLNRLWSMYQDGLFHKAYTWSLPEVYAAFLKYPTVGKFFAYQWTIDCNYSAVLNRDENDFVVPGPGADRGVAKLTHHRGDATEIIRTIQLTQDSRQAIRGYKPIRLQGLRPLHLIDIQNLMCEFDKYTRVARPELDGGGTGYKKIKQGYDYLAGWTHNPPIEYFYPPKWNLPGGKAI